jgi:outer membrane protein assembly factor BamA
VYQDDQGNPVSKEEVQEQVKRLSEYYASLGKEAKEAEPEVQETETQGTDNPLKAV